MHIPARAESFWFETTQPPPPYKFNSSFTLPLQVLNFVLCLWYESNLLSLLLPIHPNGGNLPNYVLLMIETISGYITESEIS